MGQEERDRPLGPIDDLIDLIIWLKRYPRRRELRRRKRLGLCYHCGYDAQGTADRCPECGRYPVFRKDAPEDWPQITLDAPGDADGAGAPDELTRAVRSADSPDAHVGTHADI
jgi:hypothetical protein